MFGYLEEMLKRAVYKLTGTYPVPADEAARDDAVRDWGEPLERSIVNTLTPLIDTFAKATRNHPESRHQNLDEFVQHLREAAKVRNLICHGTWAPPDENGASVPFYVTGKPGQQQVCETRVTVAWLDQLQTHTNQLACGVVDTVTHMGYQFPGGCGPGRPSWSLPCRAARRSATAT